MKNKLEALVNNDRIKNLIIFILTLAMMCKSLYELFWVSEVPYQVNRDCLFYWSAIFFMIGFLLFMRIRFLSWHFIVSLAISAVAVFAYIKTNNICVELYGEYYYLFLVRRACAICLFLVALASVIVEKKIRQVKNISIYAILLGIVYAWVIAWGLRNVGPIVIPGLLLVFAKLDREETNRFFDIFSLAYLATYCYWIGNSFATVHPSIGGKRYEGVFLNVETIGMVAGGAIICIYYLLYRFYMRKNVLKGILILLIPTFFVCYSVLTIGSRGAIVAVLFSLVLLLLMLASKGNKKRIVAFLCAFTGIIIISFLALNLFSKYGKRISLSDDAFYSSSGYVLYRINELHDRAGYFGRDSLLNSIDYFSSRRLSIWAEYLKTVRLLPSEMAVVYLDDYTLYSPHNLFVQWLVNYGAIGGLALIICFIWQLIKNAVGVFKGKEEFLFPLLWSGYCFCFFNTAAISWRYTIAVIFVLTQFVHVTKEKISTQTEQ